MSAASGDHAFAPRWHAALSFSVLGRVPDGLRETGRPELSRLRTELERELGGLSALRGAIEQRRLESRWPVPVPPELMGGLGPAQFTAALAALRRELGVDSSATAVKSSRDLDADERRLQADVPPHHGV